MNGRIASIDYLRAACVVYIVGFWHLIDYTEALHGFYNPVTQRITVLILGLFCFLSGYLLGGRRFPLDWPSVKRFFLRRTLRIYPLYLLTLGAFFLARLASKGVLVKAAVLVSMFYGPPPPTLWFITMLLVFYLVAPVLIALSDRPRTFLAASLAVFGFILLLVKVLPVSDVRIGIYFPAFALGIYLASPDRSRSPILTGGLIVGLLVGLMTSWMIGLNPEQNLSSVGLATFGPAVLILAVQRFGQDLPALRWVEFLSFCGFVMYLIHRPVYHWMMQFYFPASGSQQVLYLVAVALPLIVLLSWIIQRSYDELLLRIQR